jgi:hypothetical protein
MFKTILIASRGEQPRSSTVAQPNCMARGACAGDFTLMEKKYV